jgi:hypothetical protein
MSRVQRRGRAAAGRSALPQGGVCVRGESRHAEPGRQACAAAAPGRRVVDGRRRYAMGRTHRSGRCHGYHAAGGPGAPARSPVPRASRARRGFQRPRRGPRSGSTRARRDRWASNGDLRPADFDRPAGGLRAANAVLALGAAVLPPFAHAHPPMRTVLFVALVAHFLFAFVERRAPHRTDQGGRARRSSTACARAASRST